MDSATQLNPLPFTELPGAQLFGFGRWQITSDEYFEKIDHLSDPYTKFSDEDGKALCAFLGASLFCDDSDDSEGVAYYDDMPAADDFFFACAIKTAISSLDSASRGRMYSLALASASSRFLQLRDFFLRLPSILIPG
jgi:hypothetical protein